MKKEKIERYLHCDRCGEEQAYPPDGGFVEYENAMLCERCNMVRRFDDNNPILYSQGSTDK